MISHSLRYALYAGIVAVILALSGIFVSFADREVVQGLSLSIVVLIIMISAGSLAAGSRIRGGSAMRITAVLGGLLVGVMLAALVVIEANVDLRFVFANLTAPIGETLTFGQEMVPGLAILLAISAGIGVVVAILLTLPGRWRGVLLSAIGMTVVIGLLESQISQIMTLPDGLALAGVFALGYVVALLISGRSWLVTLLISAIPGLIAGVILGVLANGGGLEAGGLLRGNGELPVILNVAGGSAILPLAVIFAFVAGIGGLATQAGRTFHNSMIYFMLTLAIIGVLNAENAMTVTAAALTFVLYVIGFGVVPRLGARVDTSYDHLTRPQRRQAQTVAGISLLLLLVVAPAFLGQYITDVLNLVGLYIIMGIGLNIVVGYAGLLDLGYVAFFAIGAYSIGLLTTPSLLTCGGVSPRDITPETVGTICTGVMTFWEAWPLSMLIAALFGVLLGIPILRLRGDYLAIVTLGFGEIIRLLVRFDDFKDLFGAAQGVRDIPAPVDRLDLDQPGVAFRTDRVEWHLLSGVGGYCPHRLRRCAVGGDPSRAGVDGDARRRGRRSGDGHQLDPHQAAGFRDWCCLRRDGRGDCRDAALWRVPGQLHGDGVDQRAQLDYHRRLGVDPRRGRRGADAGWLARSPARTFGLSLAGVRRALGGVDADHAGRLDPAAGA